MAKQTDEADETRDSDEQGGWLPGVSRRRALKMAGIGAGVTGLGGASTVLGQEDGAPDEGGETATPEETDGNDSLFADLVDSTFGYPLATDETDTADIEHVVEVTNEEGQGAHEDFPSEPDAATPGSFVEIPAEFYFDPVGLQVEPGDLVHFRVESGLHTVTAFTELAEPDLDVPRRVPEGVPPFTSPPLTPGQSWIYQFTEPGVYDYLCLPHLGLGMVGRIVVIDPEEDDVEDGTFDAPTDGPLFPNDASVLESEALDPANIVEQGEVAWEDLELAPPTATETPGESEAEPDNETEPGAEADNETEVGAETGNETGIGNETEAGNETEVGNETGTGIGNATDNGTDLTPGTPATEPDEF